MKWKLALPVMLLALSACAGPLPAQPTEAPPSPTATMPAPTGTPPPSETPTQPQSKTPEPSLSAPGSLPTSEYAPQPGDERLQRGNLFIEDFGVTVQPGDPAPDLRLKRRGSQEWVALSSFKGTRPVALIFGSFT